MVTPERGIAPGSIPYGERDDLEEGMQQVRQNAPGPLGGAIAPDGATPSPEVEEDFDPEEFLVSGQHSSDLPITSGLGVGPGPGPMQGVDATPTQQKLQELAINSPSAAMRHMARLALQRIAREGTRTI